MAAKRAKQGSSAHDRPVRILHLSDFHLGRERKWDSDPVFTELDGTIRKLVADGLKPDFVAITGDIAGKGKQEDYDEAHRWIDKGLCPALGPRFARKNILTVPGNHDVGNKFTPVQGAWGYYDVEWNVKSEWLQQFASYFGPTHWSFLHKNVRFTGFYASVTGSGAPEEDLQQIRTLTAATHGVRDVHAIRTRYVSGTSLAVDLHIEVDESITVREGHDISSDVTTRLLAEGPDVLDVVVHLEPHQPGEDAGEADTRRPE